MSEHLVVLCTCPDEPAAERLAAALVEEGLAACVNRLGPLVSDYLWEGHRESEREFLLLAKTTRAGYPALEARLLALHPYDTPEVIALPVAAGARAYLDWVADSVTKTK